MATQVGRFGIRYEGHDIEVAVDGDPVDVERARVVLDGEPVDASRVTVRSHDLAFRTEEGLEVRLHVGGRALDALVRVRLRRADGYWVDLEERSGGPSSPMPLR